MGKDSKDGKGKSKKGKKDVDKERELEELRLKVEEETRLEENRVRKERELKEQKDLEAIEMLFALEKDRLLEELDDCIGIEKRLNVIISSVKEEIQKKKDWDRYIKCSSLPDPREQRDMFSFFGLLENETVIEEIPSFQQLNKQLPDAEELCSDIEINLASSEDESNENEILRLDNDLIRLRHIINDKWDETTNHILQHLDHFPREPNENFQLTTDLVHHYFGVW
ncbi:hypothetical protein HK096_007297, partial [Nowakowskiella sp. JEL0078]